MSEIQELRAEVAELRRLLESVAGRGDERQIVAHAHPVEPATANRRSMLRLAAGAAAGAVVGTVATNAGPVAADNGDPILAGDTTISGAPDPWATVLRYTNNAAPVVGGLAPGTTVPANAFLVRDDPSGFAQVVLPSSSSNPAAVAGYAYSVFPNGVYGRSNVAGGHGVVGSGAAASIGVLAQGGRANLRLDAAGPAAPARSDAHQRGEIINDANGDVWRGVTGGTPGRWRKVAGPSAAGAFHAITPTRVYDSRWADGKIAANTNKIVSVADGRDLNSGTVTVANLVPAGATAVVGNLTIAGTNAGAGALAVTPGNAATFTASTINWNGAGVLLANGFTCALDTSRQLKVFCLGTGTNFLIDISGYYR